MKSVLARRKSFLKDIYTPPLKIYINTCPRRHKKVIPEACTNIQKNVLKI